MAISKSWRSRRENPGNRRRRSGVPCSRRGGTRSPPPQAQDQGLELYGDVQATTPGRRQRRPSLPQGRSAATGRWLTPVCAAGKERRAAGRLPAALAISPLQVPMPGKLYNPDLRLPDERVRLAEDGGRPARVARSAAHRSSGGGRRPAAQHLLDPREGAGEGLLAARPLEAMEEAAAGSRHRGRRLRGQPGGRGDPRAGPGVDIVFGPQTLHRLPELLDRARRTGQAQVDISFPEIEKFDRLPEPRAEGRPPSCR